MCTYEHAFDVKGLMNVVHEVVEGKPPDLPVSYSKELNDLLKTYVLVVKMDVGTELFDTLLCRRRDGKDFSFQHVDQGPHCSA